MAVYYVKDGQEWVRATRSEFVRAQHSGLPTKKRNTAPSQYPSGKRRQFK